MEKMYIQIYNLFYVKLDALCGKYFWGKTCYCYKYPDLIPVNCGTCPYMTAEMWHALK